MTASELSTRLAAAEATITRLERRIAGLERDAQAAETDRLRARYVGLLTAVGVAIGAAAPIRYHGYSIEGQPNTDPDNSDAGRLARVLQHLRAARQRATMEDAE